IEGFMAQTGDGKNFNGTGGSKYPNLAAEFSNVPFKRGIVGMARAQSVDSANSQFFIMFAEGASLNGKYTVIGEGVSGMGVRDRVFGRGRVGQNKAGRTGSRSRQDGEGAGRIRRQVRPWFRRAASHPS